ncbi:MAG TPA: DUF4159 domain-containing protein [Prolixibacteraceae bacterium]|nr:DUF4159 domain-containing protein [Prolixibacteraceae bacterium]HPS13306.1 DUF4159 domain-containing protein [Prolixibacteraceae bacterium]
MKRKLFFVVLLVMAFTAFGQQKSTVKIGLLKYNGGGDWYANPTSLPNLIAFANANIHTNIQPEPGTVEVGSVELFSYPMIHMTGHGNVVFSDAEVQMLRTYLMGGGFLHIDDNYGLDPYIRREMKKVFPDQDFVELPANHPIYHQHYQFEKGLPKIHEHDGKPAQGFGLFNGDKLVVFYSYECDLGDGWESPAVHHDPESVRTLALEMGANIISYVFDRKEEVVP